MEQLVVIPNVTSQFLHIEVAEEIYKEDLSIFNFAGCKVENYIINIDSNEIEIDVSGLHPGIYFIIVIERIQGVIKKGKFSVTKC